MSILRLLNRLMTGRVRFGLILFVFVILVILSVKSLPKYTGVRVNHLSDLEFQEHVEDEKDSLDYAVMIDAGSSGSRLQIYVWSGHSGDPKELLNIRLLKDPITGKDVYKEKTPGLSSTSSNPSLASDVIEPLLDFASTHVPKAKHKTTPLYILATAGMRMLNKKDQDEILQDLRRDIPKKYSFQFDDSHFQVITGKEEGIYAWIALNYLTHKFNHKLAPINPITINLDGRKSLRRERTIGMIDMGGASSQIAFEINNNHDLEEIKQHEGSHLEDVLVQLNLSFDPEEEGHKYLLYVKTFLGLGANEAREEYWKQLFQESKLTSTQTNSTPGTRLSSLSDPCLNPGTKESKVYPENQKDSSEKQIDVQFNGSGDFDQCHNRLKSFLDVKREDSAICSTNTTSCPLTELSNTRVTFEGTEFYGFSEFFYSTDDVYHLGGIYNYQKISEATRKHCSTHWNSLENQYNRKLYPRADDERLRYECFKASWIMTFLHEGLKMPTSFTDFRTIYEVEGNTVQWTLGALILKTKSLPLKTLYGNNDNSATESSSGSSNILLFVCIALILVSVMVYFKQYMKPNQWHQLRVGRKRKDSSEDSFISWQEEAS